jgi:hypothetical protein
MSRRDFVRSLAIVVLVQLVVIPQLPAQTRDREEVRRSGPGTGNPDAHLVPWRFLQTDDVIHDKPVTLYWIAASLEQAEKSPLMTSRRLLDASLRCVDFEVILPDRAAALAKLDPTMKAPAALIVDGNGKVTRKIDNVRELVPKDVENLLDAELSLRDAAMYREMTEAGKAAKAGNNAAAIELYQMVWNDRCLFSVAGTEAQRALKQLGVVVKNPPAPPPPPDPSLKPSRTTTSG